MRRRNDLRIGSAIALGLGLGLGANAFAKDEERPAAAAVGDAVESCVDGSVLRFGAADRRAVLQDADAAAVSAAIVRRYPLVAQDGLAPKDVLLWKQPKAGWIYVALLANPAKGGEFCFTASFSASRFKVTAQMLAKYFNVGSVDE